MVKKSPKKEESDSSSEEIEEVNENESEAENVNDSSASEGETEDEVAEDQVDTSSLKEKVTGYIKIDNLIREEKEKIKELNEKKQKYEEFIKEYLEKANKNKIETNDGDIVYKKQSTKAPLKDEILEKAIIKQLKDVSKINNNGTQIAHDILEEINTMRGVNVKNSIRRVVKKNASKKK